MILDHRARRIEFYIADLLYYTHRMMQSPSIYIYHYSKYPPRILYYQRAVGPYVIDIKL